MVETKQPSDYKQVWDKAVKLLSLRLHTHSELLRKLQARKFDLDTINQVLDRGIPVRFGLPLTAAEEVVQLVARHGQQPVAELAALPVILEFFHRPRHRAHDFLRDVGGIGVLQPPMAAKTKNDR